MFTIAALQAITEDALGLITGRNEVVAKVMFLLLSVILLTGGVYLLWGGCLLLGGLPQCMLRYHHPPEQTPPWEQTSPLGADPWEQTPLPPGADSGIRSMSGRYASYWNAFLF